jgi:transposase
MIEPVISTTLWSTIEPLLSKETPKGTKGGRPHRHDRAVLAGIVFVLKTSSGGSL